MFILTGLFHDPIDNDTFWDIVGIFDSYPEAESEGYWIYQNELNNPDFANLERLEICKARPEQVLVKPENLIEIPLPIVEANFDEFKGIPYRLTNQEIDMGELICSR